MCPGTSFALTGPGVRETLKLFFKITLVLVKAGGYRTNQRRRKIKSHDPLFSCEFMQEVHVVYDLAHLAAMCYLLSTN